MSQLALPDHLAPLLGTSPFIDVVGMSDPWAVPDRWLEETQQAIRGLIERFPPAQAGEAGSPYRPGNPMTLPYAWSALTYLPAPAPIFVGPHAQLAQTLLEPWYRPEELVRPGQVQTFAIRRWDWLLDLVYNARAADPAAVPAAVEISIEVCELLGTVPTHRDRATAAARVLRRAQEDAPLIDAIQRADWATVDARWQQDHALVTDEDAAVLPELRGWASLVAWGLNGLDAAHAHLTDRVGGAQTAEELIASMVLYDKVDELPAAVGAALGPTRFQDVRAAIERERAGFDAPDWLGDTRGWLARAMVNGEIDAARIWLAMATHVAYFTVRLANPDLNTTCPNRIGFWEDVQAIFKPAPAVRNPFAARLQARAPAATDAPPVPGTGERLREHDAADAADAAPQPVEIGDPMAELAELIGLDAVKEQVQRLVAEVKAEQLRREIGMPASDRSRHMVFLGNPGTAKTTVARLLARVYAQLGVLDNGHLVEVSRQDLVGEFIGQTAPRTTAASRTGPPAEFCSSTRPTPWCQPDSFKDFGHEAIATLLKLMEDRRDEVVVIVAGYPHEMQRFLTANTGLASRFPTTVGFPDYGDDELVAIFEMLRTTAGYSLDEYVAQQLRQLFPRPRPVGFGNGRFVRNVFEETVARQAQRIVRDGLTVPDEIRTLRWQDLPTTPPPDDKASAGTGLYL